MAIIGRKEGVMLSSFTTRFSNFIWFLIFTFTLYSIPHFEFLFPYKFHLFFHEAQAAEAQAPEAQTGGDQGLALPQSSEEESSSEKLPATELSTTASSATT